MKIAVVCVVRNAEFRIAEWIAYQLVIGFDAVILLNNDSTDRTVEEIIKFTSKYDVRIINWPMTGSMYQCNGYEYALWKFRNEFEWCACVDIDEFIDPPAGKKLFDMLPSDEKISGLAVPWAIFGSAGHITRPNDSVIESYIRRSENTFVINRHFKSIVRPNRVISCLNAHAFDVEGTYTDTFGERIAPAPGITDNCLNFSNGKINHYFVQSRQCWEEKLSRGYRDGTRRSPDDFDAYDRNEVEDIVAKSKIKQVMAIIESVNKP